MRDCLRLRDDIFCHFRQNSSLCQRDRQRGHKASIITVSKGASWSNFTIKSGGDTGRGHAKPQGRSSRPEWPRAGVGFLGRGERASSSPESECPVSSHSMVRGRAPLNMDFMHHFAWKLSLVATIFAFPALKFSDCTFESGGEW